MTTALQLHKPSQHKKQPPKREAAAQAKPEKPSHMAELAAAHVAEMLAIADIHVGATNPRTNFNPEKLKQLAESFTAHGVLQPILVRPAASGYELIAGERRYRAALLAKLPAIPATIRPMDDLTARKLQFVENIHREDLNPIEQAAGLKALLDLGCKPEDLAKDLQCSPDTIQRKVALLRLPADAKAAVVKSELAVWTAYIVARLPNEAIRAEAVRLIRTPDGWLSEPKALRLVNDRLVNDLARAPFPTDDATLLPGVGSCESCPKRTGNDRAKFPDGSPSTCTDTACFKAKCRASILQAGQSQSQEGPADSAAEASTTETPAPASADPLANIKTLVLRLRNAHTEHPARIQLDIILDNYAQTLLGGANS